MKKILRQARSAMPRWASLGLAAMMIWALVGTGYGGSGAMAAGQQQNAPNTPNATCPGGICFTDVPAANPFFVFVNALYQDDIISGYACGGPGEPCDGNNRPYYRPNNSVTRAQMAKFVDNGRRNIADAIGISLRMTDTSGISLVISSTTTDSIDANNASGAEAIQAVCTRANQNCWAFYSSVATGDYAGVFAGGRGVSTSAVDDGYAGLKASAGGSTADSYGINAQSSNYRGGYVKSGQNGYYSLYVDTQDGPTQATAGLDVNGSIRGEGNLYIAGSKAGYVADIMQNGSNEVLEPGDVVTIVGNSPAVLGQIPVITVKKADTAYDTGVVGVVDQVMYVPDAATKAAYDRQEAAIRTATQQRDALMASYKGEGPKPDPSSIEMPKALITDAQGVLHAIPDATQVSAGGYATVVTLGAYKAVKVDASFGAIKAGDLLVASPHAGYAMKATDRSLTSGATIGKAVGDLATGTGLVPVIVTLK